MNSLILYFLKVNLAVAILYILYWLLFRRTTFHLINRFVLLFILLSSVIIPSIEFSFVSAHQAPIAIADWISELEEFPDEWRAQTQLVSSANTGSPLFFLKWVYVIGLGIMLWRFINQLRCIHKIRTKALQKNGFFTVKEGELPFTFMRSIFIPQNEYGGSDRASILKHEQAHANQLHTLDLLLAELFCIVFWFNPFVFLLKRSQKTVHEFLADEDVAKSSEEKISYLQLLVEGISPLPDKGVTSNFYWLTIKKRINMMTKNKTNRMYKLAYVLLIPAGMLMVQSFSGFNAGDSANTLLLNETNNSVPASKPIAEENIQKISSGFGMRMHPIQKVEKMHNGIDFVAKAGTPALATADGLVVKVEFKEEGKGYGRMVLVQHGENFATRYSQLLAFNVKVGDEIKMGDVVGLVGSSGISTGAHLHYEVIKDGKHVDPAMYFE